MKKFCITLLFTVFIFQNLFASDVENYLNEILAPGNVPNPESYIKSYLQPLSTALSTTMGGALYHRAYTKGFPRVDVGISMVYVILPDASKKFTDSMGNKVPTLFGSGGSNIDGVDKNAFVMPFLHANIGLIANLEATIRLTSINTDYLGDLSIFGAGLKYDLSDMMPVPLLDLSAQAMYHKFTLGDLMNAGTFSMNLQASVSIPVLPIDVYGGIGYDNSTLEVSTDDLDNSGGIGNVRIDGENSVHFNLGISYTMLIFNLHADYNIGEYNSIGAGVMLVL
ncbi:MAG: hypothetical protein P8X42_08610 [Calditrichaceae bacterium]